MNKARFVLTLVSFALITTATFAQHYNPDLYSGMRWRLIGPHRGGRVTAVAGIPGKPAIYYFGTPGGGVWKTLTGGRVWLPIFDDVHFASIGAIAVAPSNPDVVYVGTGQEIAGNGVYRSSDGGATWNHAGLQDTRYVSSIIVDPHNPNIVLSGARNFFAPGAARGVFRTIDGGKTWTRVLFKDDTTSVVDMVAAPDDSRVVYAATLKLLADPNQNRPLGTESLIFKSTDGGVTWRQLSGAGLPETRRGTIGLAVAPGTAPDRTGKRVYAILNPGLFRSDDGGEHWYQSTKDPRILGSNFFGRVYVDPRNPDVIYVMQTSVYRSTDGGKTFQAYKGAPSGEDQHVLWIDPDDSRRMILGSDQGAIISVDGGHNWSDWFNQPTGQFYHVITDNEFPYLLYAAQQDSGSVAVPSRSDFGEITYRDWFSTGAFESGYIAPDPRNANLIYSVGWYGTVFRLDRVTGQVATLFAAGARYRYTWETPLVFSPRDQKTLYLGMQYVMKTSDGGVAWQEISPDLTQKAPTPNGQGVIQTIAPSAAQDGVIWVGASTGLVQLTRDNGTTWHDVSPPELPGHATIILIEASLTDSETAYVIAAMTGASAGPQIYRTNDAGKTWEKIVTGLPPTDVARVIREDPTRKGLLYAGTETGVYVSFDGGDHWQPLQLSLPTTSVRDLKVHGNDLAAATYGRGLWILDDLSPLRQVSAETTAGSAYLFKPAPAIRVRWDNWTETPLPADTPSSENPPEGAILYYYLRSAAKEVSLEIHDEHGAVVQRFSSKSPPPNSTPRNVPEYWFAPPDVLTTAAGLNRFAWNLEWPHPDTLAYSFFGQPLEYIEYTLPDHAIPGKTPLYQPPGPPAVPGRYEVVLNVDGHTYRQPLVITLDPRVHVAAADLEAQLYLARGIDAWMGTSYRAFEDVGIMRAAAAAARNGLEGKPEAKEASDAVKALEKDLVEIQNGTIATPGFGLINRDLARFVSMIQTSDTRPAKSVAENAAISCQALNSNLQRWRKVNVESVPALNKLLEKYGVKPLATPTVLGDSICPN